MRHIRPIQSLLIILPLSGCASEQLARLLPSLDRRIDEAPMRTDTKGEARSFFNRPNPKAFAFSPEKGTYWAQWGAPSVGDAKELAMRNCEKNADKPCVLFAVNNKIVWQPAAENSPSSVPEDKLRASSTPPEQVAVAPHTANPVRAPATGTAPASEDDLDRTIQGYSQTLILVPDDETAIESLYVAYIRRAAAAELRDEKLAMADYTRAIELKPSASFAYKRRGRLQLERGATAAVADLIRAQERDPGDAATAKLLAGAQQAVAVVHHQLVANETITGVSGATASSPTGNVLEVSNAVASVPDTAAAEPVLQPEMTAVSEIGSNVRPSRTYYVLADVTMRRGPGNGYPSVSFLTRNTTVSVVGEHLGWLRIRLDNGGGGFVYKKWLSAAN